MAVAATTAGSTEKRRSTKADSSIFRTMIRFVIFSTLFTFMFGAFFLIHNCKIADKPWIPKSKPFCNDVEWSLNNMVIRGSLKKNFYTTMESLHNVTIQKFVPSAATHAGNTNKLFWTYFDTIKNLTVENFNKFSHYVTETYGDQIEHVIEFLKHLASDITEAATEIFHKLLDAAKYYIDYSYKLTQEYIQKAQDAIKKWQKTA